MNYNLLSNRNIGGAVKKCDAENLRHQSNVEAAYLSSL